MKKTHSISNDPFVHLPNLRGRFIHPVKSNARVTPEVLEKWDQSAFERGSDITWRLPDDEREALRRDFMSQIEHAGDVWVFAYGSLMWDPALYFEEVRAAALVGYQRRFNYKVIGGRGTPEQPGLVLSLMPEPGARCNGLAFRIAMPQVDEETAILWRREMLRGGYAPAFLPMETPQGSVQAIVFVAHDTNPSYVHDLTQEQTAHIVANASGHLGSNGDYLFQLAHQLQALGITDPYIDDLYQRVTQL